MLINKQLLRTKPMFDWEGGLGKSYCNITRFWAVIFTNRLPPPLTSFLIVLIVMPSVMQDLRPSPLLP